ncbi:uncharacterized protein LOC124273980 [Haliotis rubra]|uniref:uncharacterized protein LOC124273980 n=1 Tax=Haliotis rubra TaxID=36100 RepID=UPI001EE5D25D|nr:uncharacterized protein LOC124273980 [Haliotis rubra]
MEWTRTCCFHVIITFILCISENFHKEDCFTVTSVNGQKTYICQICGKMLSRKQRILTHLNSRHKKSPLKRVYNRYKSDSTVPVPKRTIMRHQDSEREDETLIPDAPSLPVYLPETETHVSSCEASTSTCNYSLGNIPFNMQDLETTDTGSEFDQNSSSSSHNSSDDEDDTSDDEEEDDHTDTEICEAIADDDVSQPQTSNSFSPQEINMLCMVSYLLRFNVSGCQAKEFGKAKVIHHLNSIYMHLVRKCKDLYENGISIQPSTACEPFVVKMAVLLATMDLQAKAYVLNMTMHNGSFGCSTCEEEGETVAHGKGYARHYPYKPHFERPASRQSDDIKYLKGPQATRTNRIKGICGMTGLSSMPWFDVVDGVVPDYMHGVLLGVTKKLLYMWLSPTSDRKPYFVGKDISTISKRLKNICPPDYVERLPRDLEKNYSHLKASELQAWLLFYSIPCLNGILDAVYLEHFTHLSEGIYILLGDRITQQDLERAESLLEHFYSKFGELYGEGSCGLNVHNIGVHLVTFVRKWGPLWCWSCFPFEDMNADILKAVHGTGDVTSQYLHLKELRMKICNINLDGVDQQRTDFIYNMKDGTNKCWKGLKKMKNCQIAGQPKPLSNITANTQIEILRNTDTQDLSSLRKLQRVLVNQQKLYSQEYTRMKKRVCYAVRCHNGIIAKILFFILNVTSENVFAVVKKMTLAQNCFLFETCGFHLMNVEDTDDVIQVVPVDDIMEKVFLINIDDVSYVAMMPNIIGHGVFK